MKNKIWMTIGFLLLATGVAHAAGVTAPTEAVAAAAANPDPMKDLATILASILSLVKAMRTGGPGAIFAAGALITAALKFLSTPKGAEVLNAVPEHVTLGKYNVPVKGLLPIFLGMLAFSGDALTNGGSLTAALWNGFAAGFMAKGAHVFLKFDVNRQPVGITVTPTPASAPVQAAAAAEPAPVQGDD